MKGSQDKADLAGLRLLIPRPAHRGAALRSQIQRLGGEARCIPALHIQSTAAPASVRRQLQGTTFDAMVFTSVNAVHHWFAAGLSVSLPRVVFGVGQATAQALAERGVIAQVPAQHDTEGLLATPALKTAQSVVLVTGVGGRQTLRTALAAGKTLVTVELYQREPNPALASQLAPIANWANVILASSAETYAAVVGADAALKRALLACPVVAPSERVIQHVRTLGSNAPAWLAAPFGDAAVLQALRAHWVKPPNHCARDDD